jgi:hypothetical protein
MDVVGYGQTHFREGEIKTKMKAIIVIRSVYGWFLSFWLEMTPGGIYLCVWIVAYSESGFDVRNDVMMITAKSNPNPS